MTAVYVVLAAIFAAGLAVGLYAMFAPRAVPQAAREPELREPSEAPPDAAAAEPEADWTTEAGEEFAGLPEAARCDLIFAVCDLRDDRSQQLLVHALDDPSDAVALAAAHALAQRGCSDAVDTYAQQHPGERAQQLLETLTLLG
jgi:hypothetical protein